MCVTVCFSFPFPSPKEPKGFPRVLMVFLAVILSTSAMAGCLPTALRHVDVGDDDDRRCWTGYRIVICRSNFWPFFDQFEMETMERVTHKTLIALNKEKTALTGSSGNGGG